MWKRKDFVKDALKDELVILNLSSYQKLYFSVIYLFFNFSQQCLEKSQDKSRTHIFFNLLLCVSFFDVISKGSFNLRNIKMIPFIVIITFIPHMLKAPKYIAIIFALNSQL